MIRRVAVLFAEKKGVYSRISWVDVWDKERNAMAYSDDHPVVCHPPCQLWGPFAQINYNRWGGEHNRPGNDGGFFAFALSKTNECGGVLEHPAKSKAFAAHGLKKPIFGEWLRSGDGYVTEVWQSCYGHKARKATWLYYVGEPLPMYWSRREGTHQIGWHGQREKSRSKPTLGKREASATPPAFALELLKLAMLSRTVGGKT